MKSYSYRIIVKDANDSSWSYNGTATGEFSDIGKEAERAALKHMMEREKSLPVYDKPGAGCKGPYQVTHLFIEQATAKLQK